MSFRLKNVLISEPVDSACEELLQQQGIRVTTKIGLPKAELIKEIGSYDGLIVRSATKVTSEIIQAGKNLCIIGRAGTGVDNIDCDAATQEGILVINAPGGNTLSAAELTCGMIVTMSRNIPLACSSLKSGKWDRKNFMGNELMGKTLGIVGLGRIGREVASRMQAFGMKTIGFDPLVPPEVSKTFGVEGFSLDAIWPQADYITLHVPLIPQTKNLMNDDVFAKCKKGIKVVNCARGGIIDEDALLRALESGQCGGAGLDVYSSEPPPKDLPLLQHPLVICTPHLGASTHEGQKACAVEIATQFIDLINGKAILGVVNSPTFCQSLAEENQDWISLCQALGSLLATFKANSSNEKISISLEMGGNKMDKIRNVLEYATLIGFLKQIKCDNANFVNGRHLAKQSNIVVTSMGSSDVLPGSIKVTISIENETPHTIIGTIKGNEPFLCAIDDFSFDTPPFLKNNLLMGRGEMTQDTIVRLLDSLMSKSCALSAYMSNKVDNKSWFIIIGNSIAQHAPKDLKESFDFWAELQL